MGRSSREFTSWEGASRAAPMTPQGFASLWGKAGALVVLLYGRVAAEKIWGVGNVRVTAPGGDGVETPGRRARDSLLRREVAFRSKECLEAEPLEDRCGGRFSRLRHGIGDPALPQEPQASANE